MTAWNQSFKEGLITGIAIGLVLLILVLVLVPLLPNLPFVAAAKLAVWKRFLACFYGGLYEEIFTRLFLLTLLAWIANKAWRKQTAQLSAPAFWTANVLVAILFGLGHLPSASLVMPITPFGNRGSSKSQWHRRTGVRLSLQEARPGVCNDCSFHG